METTDITKLLLESWERLHKYACGLTWDWHKADDLLQETAVRVLCNASKFRGGNFYSWACKVMYNSFINNLKRDKYYQCVDDLSLEISSRQPLADKSRCACGSDSNIHVCDIYDAIDNLPGDTGRVMRLLIEGHKYVEIALITELPLGTVKTHIHLSREILKRMLKECIE